MGCEAKTTGKSNDCLNNCPLSRFYGNLDSSAAATATRPTDLRISAHDFLLALGPQHQRVPLRFTSDESDSSPNLERPLPAERARAACKGRSHV